MPSGWSVKGAKMPASGFVVRIIAVVSGVAPANKYMSKMLSRESSLAT